MSRSPLFIDTGYFRGLLDENDRFHRVAMRWQRALVEVPRTMVTSTAVLLELGNHFCKPGPFESALPLFRNVLLDAEFVVIEIGVKDLEAGLALRASRKDKDWGLTDCTSFLIMRDFGIREALACDQHFRQAGFRAMLLDGSPIP
jgi:predicted nucleic acid-binding protein